MTRRLRFAALAALVALAFSACANNDAKESDVVNAMEDAGLDTDQAECVGELMQEEFGDDQDLYNDVAAAADTDDFPSGDDVDEDDYPEGTGPVISQILSECIEGEGATTTTGEGGTTTTAGETPETTATTVPPSTDTTAPPGG
jgi:hypothetical protein